MWCFETTSSQKYVELIRQNLSFFIEGFDKLLVEVVGEVIGMLREGFVCDLQNILAETGVKQKKLCEITGLKASAMSSIVRGETDPPTTTSILIAEFLGKRVEEIWINQNNLRYNGK